MVSAVMTLSGDTSPSVSVSRTPGTLILNHGIGSCSTTWWMCDTIKPCLKNYRKRGVVNKTFLLKSEATRVRWEDVKIPGSSVNARIR